MKEFGTYKDGSSIFKDKKGYYIVQWDNTKGVEYKKYLKGYKPEVSDTRLVLDPVKRKWVILKKTRKAKQGKKGKKAKQTRKGSK